MRQPYFNIRFFLLFCWWLLGVGLWCIFTFLLLLFASILFIYIFLKEAILRLKPPLVKRKKPSFF